MWRRIRLENIAFVGAEAKIALYNGNIKDGIPAFPKGEESGRICRVLKTRSSMYPARTSTATARRKCSSPEAAAMALSSARMIPRRS